MKNSKVMNRVKANLHTEVNPSMVQKCVSALPEVAPGSPLIPLLKLQISYFPKWVYAVLCGVFLLLFLSENRISVSGMIWYAGQMMYTVAALLGVHVLMAGRSDMLELECTCKYQYSQIYLARVILSVCYLFVCNVGLNIIFIIKFGRTRMIWNAIILFPLVAGAGCALAILQLFRIKSDFIPFVVLIGTAVVVQFILVRKINIIYHFELEAVALFGVMLLFVLVQGWCFMGRRLTYEAYNM